MSKELDKIMKKHALFPYTQPIGYNMTAVDTKIKEYVDALNGLKELASEKESTIRQLKQEIEEQQKTITNLYLQLNSMEVPIAETNTPSEDKEKLLEDFAKNEVANKKPSSLNIKIIGGGGT